MNTQAQRRQANIDLMKRRRETLAMSQGDVASAVRELLGGSGFSQQSYAAIESGKTKHSKFLPQIAKALGLPEGAFDVHRPPMRLVSDASAGYLPDAANISPTAGKLPVIGYVAAGAFCEAVDNFHPGDADEWIDAPGPVGPRSFVLIIEGISMYDPTGPISFAEGDRVVVDPDKESISGDFVVAKLTNENRVTFKRLRMEGDEWFLEALNPEFKPKYIRVNQEWHICGRAMWRVEAL